MPDYTSNWFLSLGTPRESTLATIFLKKDCSSFKGLLWQESLSVLSYRWRQVRYCSLAYSALACL